MRKTVAIDRKSPPVSCNGIPYRKQSRESPGIAPTGGEYFLTALMTQPTQICEAVHVPPPGGGDARRDTVNFVFLKILFVFRTDHKRFVF